MNNNVFIASFFAILAFSAACFAQETENAPGKQEKKDEIKVYLTHGVGGSVRENETFFGEESVLLNLELPPAVIKDQKFELQVKTELYSKKQPGKAVQPVQAVSNRSLVWKNTGPIHILNGVFIPKDCEPGDYEIRVTVSDSLNLSFLTGNKSIKVRKQSDFGIRSFVCQHQIPGTDHWAVGSNYYTVGDYARISLSFGGLTPVAPKNDLPGFETVGIGEEITAELSYEIIDGDGNKVAPFEHFPEGAPVLKNFGDESSVGSYHLTLPLPQPGNYIARATLKDANSNKTDTQEIPIFVIPLEQERKKPTEEPASSI